MAKQPYVKSVAPAVEEQTTTTPVDTTSTTTDTAAPIDEEIAAQEEPAVAQEEPAPVEKGAEVIDKDAVQSEIKSGEVVSKATDDVGTVSTVAEVQEVKTAKLVNTGELIFSEDLLGLMQKVEDTKNQVAINAVNAVKQYMADMGPSKTMSVATGAMHQVSLFRAIRSIIDFSGNDFQIAFVTVLRMFDEFKDGVFHERFIFRFMESVTLSTHERFAFERIVNLMKIAAPVKGRAEALKQVNLQKTLQYTFSDLGKNRVLGFFNK